MVRAIVQEALYKLDVDCFVYIDDILVLGSVHGVHSWWSGD